MFNFQRIGLALLAVVALWLGVMHVIHSVHEADDLRAAYHAGDVKFDADRMLDCPVVNLTPAFKLVKVRKAHMYYPADNGQCKDGSIAIMSAADESSGELRLTCIRTDVTNHVVNGQPMGTAHGVLLCETVTH